MPRRDDDSDLDYEPRRRRRPVRRKPDNRLIIVLVCVFFGLLFAGMAGVGIYVLVRQKPTAARPVAAASDLERLAGSWECTFRDPAGNITMRKVKVITGTTETATWYRADGTVFRVNRVEFALDVRGRDKVFRYFNGWVTNGPGAGPGQPFPPGEYVYTLEGDTWTEYDPGGVIVWMRRR